MPRQSVGARLNASMLLAMTIAVTRFRRTLDKAIDVAKTRAGKI